MRTIYNIRITSRNLSLVFILIALLVGIITPTCLLSTSGYKFDTVFYCLIDLIVVFFLVYVFKPISKKEAIITIDEKFLIVNLPSFIFRKNRVVEIPWSELDAFLIEPTQYLTKVKFKLKNGKKIIFFLDPYDSKKNDYISFKIALYKKIININEVCQSKGIARGKTIYESLLGLVLAILFSVFLLVIPFIYMIRQVNPSFGNLLIVYSSGFYFIWMVYKSRKK